MKKNTDILIIGSGIGGLSFAIKVAEKKPDKKILILTKNTPEESNTQYAQGGIAVVQNLKKDSFQKHIHDTLRAGDGLCNKEVVEKVIKKAPTLLRELTKWGAVFDPDNKKYKLHKEGGHSEARIVHHKDQTGKEIIRSLLDKIKKLPNIIIRENCIVLDLLVTKDKKENMVYKGVKLYDSKKYNLETIFSDICFIATGGIGQIYLYTSNPLIATGDGIAMAYRAGAIIKDMEFVQFHPTVLYEPSKNPMFLISEAVRGFGAKLKTVKGALFMHQYDKRAELAPRDIVSRAIFKELKYARTKYVYLDCRHLDKKSFYRHFPTIVDYCIKRGIHPHKDMIPVVPAAHYLCGGIAVDLNGETSVKNLYACGECTQTGLHGANRLASNSLLEALAFSDNASKAIINKYSKNIIHKESIRIDEAIINIKKRKLTNIKTYKKKVKTIMNNSCGIVRNTEELKTALEKINMLEDLVALKFRADIISPELQELKNMIVVSKLVIVKSLERKENRGTFYNEDSSTN